MFFLFRIVAGIVVGVLVLGGVGGVLGWYFTRGKDDSLGGPYKRQAVATDNKQCSEIGNKILNSNGSAVDAAIAAMFCLGVINMQSSGVGGGGVMLVYNRTLKKATVIDFRETAPGATTSHMFPPTKTGEDMSKHGLLCSFLSVIYDNQKTIREECHVCKLPCNYNQVSSHCLTTQWRIQTFNYQFGLRIKGGPRPPGPLPWIYHCDHLGETPFELWLKLKFS